MGPTSPRYWWNVVPSAALASAVAAPCQLEVSALAKPPMMPFGVQPAAMKKDMMRPQARNAGRFGMIMPVRNVPNFWILTCALLPRRTVGATVGAAAADMPLTLLSVWRSGAERGPSPGANLH